MTPEARMSIYNQASNNLRLTSQMQTEFVAQRNRLNTLAKKAQDNSPFDSEKIKKMKERLQSKGLYDNNFDGNSVIGGMMRETALGMNAARRETNMNLGLELGDFSSNFQNAGRKDSNADAFRLAS